MGGGGIDKICSQNFSRKIVREQQRGTLVCGRMIVKCLSGLRQSKKCDLWWLLSYSGTAGMLKNTLNLFLLNDCHMRSA